MRSGNKAVTMGSLAKLKKISDLIGVVNEEKRKRKKKPARVSSLPKASVVGQMNVMNIVERSEATSPDYFATKWSLTYAAAELAYRNHFLKNSIYAVSDSKTGVCISDIKQAQIETFADDRWFTFTFLDTKTEEPYSLDLSTHGRMRLNEEQKDKPIPNDQIKAAIDYLDRKKLASLREVYDVKKGIVVPSKNTKIMAEVWGLTDNQKKALRWNPALKHVAEDLFKAYPDGAFTLSGFHFWGDGVTNIYLYERGEVGSVEERKHFTLHPTGKLDFEQEEDSPLAEATQVLRESAQRFYDEKGAQISQAQNLSDFFGLDLGDRINLYQAPWVLPAFKKIKELNPNGEFYPSDLVLSESPRQGKQLDFKIRGVKFNPDEFDRLIITSNYSCRTGGSFSASREFNKQAGLICSNIYAVTQMQHLGNVWGWEEETQKAAFDNLWAARPLMAVQQEFAKDGIHVPTLYPSQVHCGVNSRCLRGRLAKGEDTVLHVFSIREIGQHNIPLSEAGPEESALADRLHEVLKEVTPKVRGDFNKGTFRPSVETIKAQQQKCAL